MRRPDSPGATSRVGLLAAAVLAMLLCGCGLFSPAKPEPPLSNDCDPVLPEHYDTPTEILDAMRSAMLKKKPGRCAYMYGIADSAIHLVSFRHVFPKELVVERDRLRLTTPVWTRALEDSTFYNDFMELTDSPFDLTWLPHDEMGSDTGQGSDSTLYRRYIVTPRGGAEILAAGTAELVFRHLRNTQGELVWVLIAWYDDVDPSRGTDTSFLLDLTASQRRLEAYDANF